MPVVNALICSPSPRDIPAFREGQNTIPCDKLLVKYHHAKRAYKIMRSYFLDHKEYTHMILHPDDLIVNQSHYNTLKQNVEEYDYQVISGVCNISVKNNKRLAIDITNLPKTNRRVRKYDFASTNVNLTGIIKVVWAGFPFMWIRRDVIEKIELVDDSQWNQQDPNKGWSFDVVFCYYCDVLDIPIYANLDVKMEHLKDKGHLIKTGGIKPKVVKIHSNLECDITEECHNKYLTEKDWTPYPHLNTTTHKLQMI